LKDAVGTDGLGEFAKCQGIDLRPWLARIRVNPIQGNFPYAGPALRLFGGDEGVETFS
jgi:hypothetical protein